MLESDDAAHAEVFDFLDEYLDDLERGIDRPLAEYLARHPDHEEAIAREWIARRGAAAGAGGDDGEARRVGPYRLVGELGRGGQGSVWLADDTRIARRVALKLFDTGIVSAERRARLRREAEVIARLAHPGICAIHDAVVGGDTPYIAMRYVEGVVLARALERARKGEGREPLPWIPRDRAELVRVLRLFERAARALHAAHEAGVVHRDVKPANVMVTAGGEPVILDFGIARDERSLEDPLTIEGEVFGSPGYTSPEQLRGASVLDARTDVWSLGVTLYEALTGEKPFRGSTRYELERAVMHAPLPDPRELAPVLDDDVRAVLETALAKERERRYASALELAEDLRRICEYEPVGARRASAALRLRRWMQRQPALATAVIGTIVLLATSLAITLTLLARVQRAHDQKDVALSLALGRDFAGQARDAIGRDQGLALALAVEAVERAPALATRAALFDVLDACRLDRVLEVSEAANQLQDVDVRADAAGRPVLAASADDGTVRAWDLRTGRELARLRPEPGEIAVLHLALGPGATTLATVSATGVLRRFELGRDEPLWSRTLCAGALVWVEHDPRGERLAVLSSAHGGWIVDAASGDVLARVDVPDATAIAGADDLAHEDAATAGAGDLVRVAAGDAALAKSPDAALAKPPGDAPAPYAGVAALRFDPTGTTLLASGLGVERGLVHSRRALLYDAASGALRGTLDGHGDSITWAEFDATGERVATASRDGTARLWDARTGALLGEPFAHEGVVTCATFDAGGERLATTTDAGELSRACVWRIASRERTEVGSHDQSPIVHAAFSPDGELLATTAFDLSTRVWRPAAKDPRARQVEVLRALYMPLEAVWTPDGSRLITRSNTHSAHVWSVGNLAFVYTLRGHAGAVLDVAFDESGERALSASSDGTVRVWAAEAGECRDREPGRELLLFAGHAAAVVRAGFVRGGAEVLSASADGTARRFDATDGRERMTAVRHDAPLVVLEWSERADRAVTIDASGEARLWRISDARELARWPAAAAACAFSVDGVRFAVAMRDGAVDERDATSGAVLGSLPGALDAAGAPLPALDLAYSPRTGELAIAAAVPSARSRSAPSPERHRCAARSGRSSRSASRSTRAGAICW